MQRLRKLIEEWAFVIWLVAAILCMGWVAFLPYPSVQAAEPLKAATPEPVKACPEWMTAGKWTLYRCENEQTGEVCIHSDSGMMDCNFN